MKNNLLYTPEGVRDLYREDCEQKQILERKLSNVSKTYGYRQIQTPSFEYFDVFNLEYGSRSSRELYKFFDREGNTLVLRPDITPSIARCATTYFQEEELPLRFSYIGNTFLNSHSYQGRLRERTQLGAELIGDDSVDADAEIIALSAKMLQSAGLTRFRISIGHADILEKLFEATGLDEDTIDEMRLLIQNRNFYGMEQIVGKLNLEEHLVSLFSMLKTPLADAAELERAAECAASYPQIEASLRRLLLLDELLGYCGVSRYVSYDPAYVSRMNYYTGIMFAAYTSGSGEAVVNGGRYDRLLSSFGKDSPATGFVVIIDQLLTALNRQKIRIPVSRNRKWILYDEKNRRAAFAQAAKLRDNGETVELMPVSDEKPRELYEAYAGRQGISDIMYFCGN